MVLRYTRSEHKSSWCTGALWALLPSHAKWTEFSITATCPMPVRNVHISVRRQADRLYGDATNGPILKNIYWNIEKISMPGVLVYAVGCLACAHSETRIILCNRIWVQWLDFVESASCIDAKMRPLNVIIPSRAYCSLVCTTILDYLYYMFEIAPWLRDQVHIYSVQTVMWCGIVCSLIYKNITKHLRFCHYRLYATSYVLFKLVSPPVKF